MAEPVAGWLAPRDLIVYPDDKQLAAVVVHGATKPELMHWWSGACCWQCASGDCVRMGNVRCFFPLPAVPRG